ncbi:MAG TPA: hypothetical protein VJJ76_03755 [archaeon]|nr:hypothetical protein [archaeon]
MMVGLPRVALADRQAAVVTEGDCWICAVLHHALLTFDTLHELTLDK